MNFRRSAKGNQPLLTRLKSHSASQTKLNHANEITINVTIDGRFNGDGTVPTALEDFVTSDAAALDSDGFCAVSGSRCDIIECDNASFNIDNNFKLDGSDWTNIFWIIIEKTIVGSTFQFKLLELADIS